MKSLRKRDAIGALKMMEETGPANVRQLYHSSSPGVLFQVVGTGKEVACSVSVAL